MQLLNCSHDIIQHFYIVQYENGISYVQSQAKPVKWYLLESNQSPIRGFPFIGNRKQ